MKVSTAMFLTCGIMLMMSASVRADFFGFLVGAMFATGTIFTVFEK